MSTLKTFELPFDPRQNAGTWWFDPNRPILRVACPECGARADLDHCVSESGVVFPSLRCPGQPAGMKVEENWQEPGKRIVKTQPKPSCGFHGNVKLLDWPAGMSIINPYALSDLPSPGNEEPHA